MCVESLTTHISSTVLSDVHGLCHLIQCFQTPSEIGTITIPISLIKKLSFKELHNLQKMIKLEYRCSGQAEGFFLNNQKGPKSEGSLKHI